MAMEQIWALVEKVRPINATIFLHENEVLVIDKEEIQTYYRVNEEKKKKLVCARNLRILSKLLGIRR